MLSVAGLNNSRPSTLASRWLGTLAAELRQEPSDPDTPTFRGAALRAQTITAPAWVLAGPSETGKTWAALWRLDSLLRATPGAQAALVRKLRSTMDGTVLVTWKRVIARSESGATAFGGEHPQWYDYPNGARLWVGGLDNPDKILSGERDFVYVNQAEELSENDWETLTTRTTGRGAVTDTPMLFGDCNPGPEDHWIIRRRDAGALVTLESKHEDNPTLYDDAGRLLPQGERTMAVLDALTGVRYQRLRLGRWVGAEGQYFTTFDPAVHVVAPCEIPGDALIWGSLDYGYAHPLAFGLFATMGDGAIHLIGEHVASRWLIPDHATAMHALCGRLGVRPAFVVAGHDCWATRGGDDAETIADKFAKAGWELERATLDRINGAQSIMQRLGRPASDGYGAVAPSLYLWESCRRTIACLPRMVADTRNPEDVRKVDADADGRGGDDEYDMLRYGVMAAPTKTITGFSLPYDKRRR